MIKKMPYKDLTHALRYLRVQVSEGIPYVLANLPRLDSPEKIFNWLKLRTRYKNDPKGIELFQTIETLLDDNWHGITGHGDCDCFTIAALSMLLANGFTDSGIVLAGRTPLSPTHIWAYTVVNGKRYNLDLTNKNFDQTRDEYTSLQHIPYKLNQKEKNMLLELADGVNKTGHPYIWVPSLGVQVREDFFDHLSECNFQKTLLSEGYEPQEIAELSGKRFERRMEKKQVKAAVKAEKKAAKPRNVRKAARQDSKNYKRMTNADSKAVKREGSASAKVNRTMAKLVQAQNQPQPSAIDVDYEDVTDQPEYQEEIIETYDAEEIPQDDMFEGVSEIGGMKIAKPLILIGLAFAAGAAIKRFSR